nr:unnamed protein product [Digitaria exilis]
MAELADIPDVPPKTSSTYRAEKVTGTHDFEMENYSSLSARYGVGRSLKSAPFTVGGYSWVIQFFPNGETFDDCYCCMRTASAYVSLAGIPVVPATKPATAAMPKAKYTLSLVGRDSRPSRLWRARSPVRTYGWPQPTSWGINDLWYPKPLLRLSGCLAGDRLKIRCELTVFVFAAPSTTKGDATPAMAPPPELHGHLERALGDGRGSDVTFHVAGTAFRAHRVMLAARSPVFDAELFGPMAKKDDVVEIADVEPAIFEMLLHFVYTDSLPPAIFDGDSTAAAAQHLLVAADRYGMERLKIMCAEKLCRSIDVSTVTTTLALADQHHCQELKEACLAFMSSPKVLRVVVASDEFKHLMASCPQLTFW